jgi:hypothetical protein
MAENRKPPQSAKELLERYAAGERVFHGAQLAGANLKWADLTRATLYGANLSNADLRGATLLAANLGGTELRGANLTEANLFDANLFEADLELADLTGADLFGADLTCTRLHQASLGGVNLNSTNLLELDISPLCDANPPVKHGGPCRVDYTSILLSLRSPNLKDFLQRTGMPEIFVEYMVDCARTLQTDVFKMLQSTFISYGGPDEPFARKLYEALHRNGVTTFFFAEHAEPGKKLHRTMHEGVNSHDRMILVCSRASLDRKGVLNELEKVLEREARDGGASYLIPIRLDDYVFTEWKPPNADLADAVRARVVADFEDADKDDAKFNEGLRRLIAALKKSDPPKPAPTT